MNRPEQGERDADDEDGSRWRRWRQRACGTAGTGPDGAGKRPHDKSEKKSEKKPEVDEKAYKAALEKIPEPKEKYDPWGDDAPDGTGQETK